MVVNHSPCYRNERGSRGGQRGRGGRGGGGGFGDRRGQWSKPDKQKPRSRLPHGCSLETPVIRAFQHYGEELDKKNDRNERIVKLSRDVTIESKRIIFLLHRITREEDKPHVLYEAEQRLTSIKRDMWYYVAKELVEEDEHKFSRAYSPGMQEYVEAVSFYHYICYEKLITRGEIQEMLKFRMYAPPKEKESNESNRIEVEEKESEREEKKTSKDEEEKKEHEETSHRKEAVDLEEGKKQTELVTEVTATKTKKEEIEDGNKKQLPKPDETAKEGADVSASATTSPEERNPKNDDIDGNKDDKESTEPQRSDAAPCPQPSQRKGDGAGDGSANETSNKSTSLSSSDKGSSSTAAARGRGNWVKRDVQVQLTADDYVLGLADLTGEMMRQAINFVGLGNTSVCFDLLHFLHALHGGFLKAESVTNWRELRMKLSTLQQSIKKVENACYAINVRGTEVPSSALKTYFQAKEDEVSQDVEVAN